MAHARQRGYTGRQTFCPHVTRYRFTYRPPAPIDGAVQRLLGPIRRRCPDPAKTIGNAVDVRIHTDVLHAAIGENQHQVRRLAPDARQHQQLFHRHRHSTIEALDQHAAGCEHVPSLVAVEADRIDQPPDLGCGEPGHAGRRAGTPKEPRGRRSRRRVLRASREQRGDEHLKRIMGLILGNFFHRRQLEPVDGQGKPAHDLFNRAVARLRQEAASG